MPARRADQLLDFRVTAERECSLHRLRERSSGHGRVRRNRHRQAFLRGIEGLTVPGLGVGQPGPGGLEQRPQVGGYVAFGAGALEQGISICNEPARAFEMAAPEKQPRCAHRVSHGRDVPAEVRCVVLKVVVDDLSAPVPAPEVEQ